MKFTLIEPQTEAAFPFLESVKAGFPSPHEGHIEEKLDLNHFLIKHPAATFFVRVDGDSMQNAHIYHNDILIVDRALKPEHKSIIVAILNSEFTVKRLIIKDQKVFLAAENAAFSPIEIKKEMDFAVWGVVTYIIHKAT